MRRDRRKIRIQWSLFAAFAGFSLLIAVFLWLFQMLLFPAFYSSVTYWRTRRLAEEIAAVTEEDVRDTYVEEKGSADRLCIAVYQVSGNAAVSISGIHEDTGCVLHSLDADGMSSLYVTAMKAGGLIQTRYNAVDGDARLVTVYSCKNAANEEMIVFIDSADTPPLAATAAMRVQPAVLTFGMLMISLLLSYLLSKQIAKPIESLNRQAAHLSDGSFSLDEKATGYREIAELADTLTHTADELSKVDRMQKELIANISHDLRTPLTMIMGYAEVMRDIPQENTPENMQAIIDETMRLSSLVNDLLEISRIQNGHTSMQLEAFVLGDAVEKTVERYQHLKENDGFTFSYLTTGRTTIFADEKKIMQVVCNLLNNAIHYSGNSRKIEIFCRQNEEAVRFEVRDHGIGIPEQDLPHVWQRYYRVDKIHNRTTSGSGLGLSIVREILDMHKAHYGVMSRFGEGSTFWFELPLFKDEDAM